MVEGKTPEMAVEQARTLLALSETVKDDQGQDVEKPLVIGLRDLRPSWRRSAFTACRAGAVAKLRLGDFQREGIANTCCGFRRRGARAGRSRCGTTWKGLILAYIEAAKHRPVRGRIRRCSGRARTARRKSPDRPSADEQADLRAGEAAAEVMPGCRRTAVAPLISCGGDH